MSDWQPIETYDPSIHPEVVLVTGLAGGVVNRRRWYSDATQRPGAWCQWGEPGDDWEYLKPPDFWMPLPEPPVSA